MSINYGSAYRAFGKEQGKLREQYRQLGMTEDQIEAMYEFDLTAFRGDCVFLYHTQALMPQSGIEEDEGRNPYLDCFLDSFSTTDDLSAAGLFSWIDEIGDERVVKRLRSLSENDLLLLTLYCYLELTQTQIASLLGITQKAVSKRLSTLRKKI